MRQEKKKRKFVNKIMGSFQSWYLHAFQEEILIHELEKYQMIKAVKKKK